MDTILYIEASTRSEPERLKIAGVNRYAGTRRWNVQLVYHTGTKPSVKRILREMKPIGVIMESCDGTSSFPPKLFGNLPVVYLDANPRAYGGNVPAVIHASEDTSRLAMKEFAALGFERVAYAGWFYRIYWSEARRLAFEEAAREHGVICDTFAPDGREDDQIGYEHALSEWLSSLPSGVGLFAANDRIASFVLAACRRLGIGVPQEISVLGVDNDVNRCESETPNLSSIQLDFERAGYLAGELLDELISGGRQRRVTFGPLGVLRRESTRSFPRMSPKITAAMKLIRAKACDGLRAREVAAVIGGSRRLAEMHFKAATGKTILAEIQEIRLEKVRFLLAHTEKPIGSIAGFCGYKSEIALRKLFVARYGIPMREYRKANADLRLRKRND